MTIFEKGNYKTVPSEFRTFGIASLEELSKFQEKHISNFNRDLLQNAAKSNRLPKRSKLVAQQRSGRRIGIWKRPRLWT